MTQHSTPVREDARMDEPNAGRTFVSEPIEPGATYVESAALSTGEPPLPERFRWRGEELAVRRVVRTWRSTKIDRGDAYLARHWFEVETGDGRTAVVYFDRKARPGTARWWLYTISAP
jgi:hypothetical protein